MIATSYGGGDARLYSELFSAIADRRSIRLAAGPKGQLQVKNNNIFQRLWSAGVPSWQAEHSCRIAAVLAKYLLESPRLDLYAASKDKNLALVRLFIKKKLSKLDGDPRVSLLQKECLAAKLGIPSKVFDENPGFQEYAKKSHLERYLLGFSHQLKIDSPGLKLKIMKDGAFSSWDKVWKEFQELPGYDGNPSQPWLYGEQGVQKKDMYAWTELKPFKKEDPAQWGNQYIFEYCTGCADKPRMTGDHSWFRLKTPEGDIYSIGLYRPEKGSREEHYKFPFRVKEGYLMQPDISEFWPYDTLTIPIAITEEQFLRMKSAIEMDKRNDDQFFQLFQQNCTLYCHKIASLAGIKLPTAEAALRLLVREPTQQKAERVILKLPKTIQALLNRIQAISINILQVFLGAAHVDPKLAGKNKGKPEPHIRSFWDLFKVDKSEVNHPYTLGRKTRTVVLDWRQKEVEKLEEEKRKMELLPEPEASSGIAEIEKLIKKTRYSLPPFFMAEPRPAG